MPDIFSLAKFSHYEWSSFRGADHVFIELTDIPMAMLGVLQAAPHTSLWHRVEKEGRLRRDVGDDAGTFSALNFEPDRPEADIMQEYVEAWDYLYEPSRYLARAYRYHLAMRPARRGQAVAAGATLPKDRVPDQGMTLRRILVEIKAFFKILWWQGVRPSYRRQFWTKMIGMLRLNPTRFVEYIVTCAMGEDLFNMRREVREKATVIIQERQIGVPAGLQGRLAAAPLEPSSSSAMQDK